jgi:hypothetical protein
MPAPQAGANGAGTWDLDAASAAAKAEANAAPFVFTYHGTRYEVPSANAWPVEALDLLSEGELGPALRLLLGDDAYRGMVDAGLTLGDLNLLFDQLAKASGMGGLPNSPPPPKRATARR